MPFRDIVGHSQVRALLARAVRQETLPPSLLFAGPDGIGKRMTAMALAQALNCLEPVEESASESRDACGRCRACTRIERGLHSDVRVLMPNDRGAIAVDTVREVIDSANYRPFEGRRRVIIVDEAEAMTEAAQNALLKTLEEPTPSSVFVLVTSRPDMLRPTVRSRCPRVRFGLIDTEDMARGLTKWHGIPEPRARRAAAMAGGCFARALGDESDEATETRAVAADVLRRLVRAPAPRLRLELAQRLVARAERQGRAPSRALRPPGGSAAPERELLGRRLEALSVLLRDVGAVASHATPQRLANGDMAALLEEIAPGFDVHRVVRAYGAIDQALVALDRNVSPKTVADWVLMQL
ncbi:MAG: DNA polymerase III subunit delta' [Luteitalea sp.]|nr:DNA polymerase III subunit delta' [Luteitalea sp.]